MTQTYSAHINKGKGARQLLRDHRTNVANMPKEFSKNTLSNDEISQKSK
jgi:hypothetical protein